MQEGRLISSYSCDLYRFRNSHTIGSVLFFDSPCIGYIRKGSAQFLYSFYEYRFQIIKSYPCRLFDKMYEKYGTDIYVSVSYLYRILSDIFKQMKIEPVSSVKTTVQPAVDYIESNYNMPITIEKLAQLCHSCTSGLFKLFKSATGVTPIAYKHNIMIQNALDLLTHTDLTVEEISARVGFSSPNYFRRVFYDITGKTPKQVR